MLTELQGTRSAYDLPAPSYDERITLVGRGTPCGEFLRRYWHPVAVAADVHDVPVEVRALGEDLILFRTPDGRFGLMHARCAHRGTSLFYGKVEERGIRCCYHGWLFASDGRCLEQPCEPNGGKNLGYYAQPAYPVEERYGLVFAYMGPPAKQPLLPRYDTLEAVPHGYLVVGDGSNFGAGGAPVTACNWLQTYENVADIYHVYVLHSTFSTKQFHESMAIWPKCSWEKTDYGMRMLQDRVLPDGVRLRRYTEMMFPTIRIIMDPSLSRTGKADGIGWVLPIDDTHTIIFRAQKWPVDMPYPEPGGAPIANGKRWPEMTLEEHQRFPGDIEAQVSQGPITLHSEEHLVGSDSGVAMYRRQLRAAIDAVEAGGDPPNAFHDGDGLITVTAGNYLET